MAAPSRGLLRGNFQKVRSLARMRKCLAGARRLEGMKSRGVVVGLERLASGRGVPAFARSIGARVKGRREERRKMQSRQVVRLFSPSAFWPGKSGAGRNRPCRRSARCRRGSAMAVLGRQAGAGRGVSRPCCKVQKRVRVPSLPGRCGRSEGLRRRKRYIGSGRLLEWECLYSAGGGVCSN